MVMIDYYALTSIRRRHYEMTASVCLSVCLSVCRIPRHNLTMKRPRKWNSGSSSHE